ncbi:MAG: hypothetical protein QM778_17695 [Myxococcales bacterium]
MPSLSDTPFALWCLLLTSLSVFVRPGVACALDKQGSAHGGQVAGPSSGLEIGGSLLAGSALYNPSYAARPDNTGLALLRVAPHFDFDLIGHRLSIPLDVNVFSDRRRSGLGKVAPSELDLISGVTSTWGLWEGSAIELGARYERDMPVDRRGRVQTYADARAKLLMSASQMSSRLRDALHGTDVLGSATLGWFAYNPSYAARPDNSGLALLRYALHLDWSLPQQHLGFLVDSTFFSDRRARVAVRPSELDLTLGAALRFAPFEVSITFERDMPLDRGSYTQQLAFVYLAWSFTAYHQQPFDPLRTSMQRSSGASSYADSTGYVTR